MFREEPKRAASRSSPSAPSHGSEPDPAVLREAKDRGAQMLIQGNLEAALSAFQEVLKAAPHEPLHRQKVAEVLQRLGRKDEAIAEYQAAAEDWARTGWLLRAVALCKVILQLAPDHARARSLLESLHARQGAARQPRAGAPAPAAAAPPSLKQSVAPAPPSQQTLVPALPQEEPLPLFATLDREQFQEVVAQLEHRSFQPGQQIVREGEPGTSMFVIVEGAVEVVRQQEDGQGQVVAQMGEGDLFGEMALVSEGPRLASVVATAPTVLLELSRARLKEIVARLPALEETVQQFFRERLLTNVMRSHPLFAELPAALRQAIKAAFTPLTLKPGEQILTRGQPAQALYLLLRGQCSVFHEHMDGRQTPYPDMSEGDVFGEIALLRSKLATASVRATTACTLLKLEREAFEQLLSYHPNLRQQLERLGSERLQRTTRLLSGRTVYPGDTRV